MNEIFNMVAKAVADAEKQKQKEDKEKILFKAFKDIEDHLQKELDSLNEELEKAEEEEEDEERTYELADAIVSLRESPCPHYAYRKDAEDEGYIFITYDLEGNPFLVKRTEEGLSNFYASPDDFFAEWCLS